MLPSVAVCWNLPPLFVVTCHRVGIAFFYALFYWWSRVFFSPWPAMYAAPRTSTTILPHFLVHGKDPTAEPLTKKIIIIKKTNNKHKWKWDSWPWQRLNISCVRPNNRAIGFQSEIVSQTKKIKEIRNNSKRGTHTKKKKQNKIKPPPSSQNNAINKNATNRKAKPKRAHTTKQARAHTCAKRWYFPRYCTTGTTLM